jgi:ribonuclease HI
MIGRKKKDVFSYIKDRIWRRINSWRGRALSRAGKEIMIKSVLQAIPSYVMGVYLLPDSTIKDIERMMNSFWWGGGANHKGIRWLAWDRMTCPKGLGGMGFRDLHTFNLAMIAKQGWNIISKPHTLVARLYKARYFPNSTLFDSKIGHNPSYAWRGIWKARQILIHGCRWSIGNGNNINIMGEPWLRDKEQAWIPSPQERGVYNLKVVDLMHPDLKSWDHEKIQAIFSDHIAKCIIDIPLFNLIEEDKLIWVDSTHGQYSVRSGYNLMMNISGRFKDQANNEDWNGLWKIRAPPKAKHLLWRMCKDCLPTRSRLQSRCVPCPLSCPLCDNDLEDDWHVVFDCEYSIQSRQTAGLQHVLDPWIQNGRNIKETILGICSRLDEETAGRFASLVWILWNNRNNCVWNNTKEQGRALGYKAKIFWDDWNAAQHVQQHQLVHAQTAASSRWEKPALGWLKCNTDAGFFGAANRTSGGWCLRDHRGVFVSAGTSWIEGTCSVIEGEAIALLEALQHLEQRGISHVVIETDSRNLVDAIHHLHDGVSEFSLIVRIIKDVLLANPNFLVRFVKRQANLAAHTLARAACSWPSRCTFDSIPSCITTILSNEII